MIAGTSNLPRLGPSHHGLTEQLRAPGHPAGRNGMGPAHPGARASRPHALPLRAAQSPCDSAPGLPAGTPWARPKQSPDATRERGRPARMHCRCGPLSFPAIRQPACQRERHGPGRGRVLAPLPVEPDGGDGRGCSKKCAGGTPALPVGPSSHDVFAAFARISQRAARKPFQML